MLSGDIPPNQTVYIKNLNEKIKKEAERKRRAEEAAQSAMANGAATQTSRDPNYPGFKEVRMIEARPGIAFVEYEDEEQSGVAMQALQGFKIAPQFPMAISFAKK